MLLLLLQPFALGDELLEAEPGGLKHRDVLLGLEKLAQVLEVAAVRRPVVRPHNLTGNPRPDLLVVLRRLGDKCKGERGGRG